MKRLLWYKQVLLKEFGAWAEGMTERLKEASCQVAKDQKRPIVYLQSADTDKDELAREIAAEDGITSGLVAILTCLEPCMSFDIHRSKEKKKLELVYRPRKCLFLYHYWIDPQFGWMNARIESWLPFHVQVCLNGREWLARTMDQKGIAIAATKTAFSGSRTSPERRS